jgi:amidase
MVPLEFGSDIGGSIRIPSAFCGVYGHKPTYDLIPQRGHAPPGTDGGGVVLGVVGPMARTASDLDLALGVLAGPDEFLAKGYRLELPSPRHDRLADFRVLLLDRHPSAPLDVEIGSALHSLADRIEAAGAEVARVSDLLPDLAAAHGIYLQLLNAAMSRGAPGASGTPSAHTWMDLQDAQLQIRRRWALLFEAFDVVLAPVLGSLAFPHDDSPHPSQRTLMVNGEPTPYFGQLVWPGMATLANLPATAAPIGISRSGLPIAVQIIGAEFEDRTTIAFAGLIEQAFGGFRPPPAFG